MSKKCCESGDGCSSGGCSGGGCSGGACPKTKLSSPKLEQWPIKLALIDISDAKFNGADILVAADCAPLVDSDFYGNFLASRQVLMLCPKLDERSEIYIEKLSELFKTQNIRTLTVVRLEVPCCEGVEKIVVAALEKSGVNVLVKEIVLAMNGEIV